MLKILAASPQERSVKLELMVNRIGHRLNLKEETLWRQLKELRGKRAEARPTPVSPPVATGPGATGGPDRRQTAPEERWAPAARHERELLELLLAEPALVPQASAEVLPDELEHPGLRQLLAELYRLQAGGLAADLDHLHARLDNERLLDAALRLQAEGQSQPDRPSAYRKVLERFVERRNARRTLELKNQVLAANDHDRAIELLARLRNQNQ
jgi:DNA primase